MDCCCDMNVCVVTLYIQMYQNILTLHRVWVCLNKNNLIGICPNFSLNQGHNSKRHIHILICFWCMMHTCQVIYITYIIRWIAFTFSLRAIFPEDYLNEKKFNACCQKDLDNINNLPNLLFVSCQNFELSFWVNEK